MKFCSIFLPLLFSSVVLTSSVASPEAPKPRLVGAIREGARAILPGSASSRALHGQDIGPVPANQTFRGITLVFRRSEEQESELQQLLLAQQNQASAEFHHWLTPEAFGQRFGMADADLETTERWLGAQGFVITGISRARDRITFSGTAAQVASAFSATLHRYQVEGQIHVAPDSNLSLPADLAAVTTAILHLSDFRPLPNSHPAFTASADQTHYLTPIDLQVMYDLPTGTASMFTSGLGQSIAIVGQSYVDTSGSSRFRSFETSTESLSLFGVLVPNSGVEAISPGDAAETEIDLEYAGGIAPAANLFLVHVGSDPSYNVFDALAYAIDQNLAPVVSISYSECETLLSPAELQQSNAIFEQAAAQGQTLIAASGDTGSTACAAYSTSGSFSAAEQQALAVGYPASSPYVTAVGGTEMAPGTFGSTNTAYWNPAATAGFDLPSSLLSYVPEVVWNEDTSSSLFAGGGGASAVYARPAWQSDFVGMPAGTTRLVPDVALQASSRSPGFLLCTDDPNYLASEGQTYGCQQGLRADNGQYTIGGGTSFAAPVFAAMTAMINQGRHSNGQGNLNSMLYGIAANPAAGSMAFHDITSGSNACTATSPRCSAAGQSGFPATSGYDQATGLGSIDFAHLLAAWPTAADPRNGTIMRVYPYDYAPAPGATDPLRITVSADLLVPDETVPTGTVSVTVDGTVVNAALPFERTDPVSFSGLASYIYIPPPTPGSHIVVVTYLGDATHGPSTATVAILAGNVTATGGVTLRADNVTVPSNGSGSTTVTVTPTGGYNGRLFWSLALAGNSGGGATVCYSIPTLPVQGISSTPLAVGTGTACTSAVSSGRAEMRSLVAQKSANGLLPAPLSAVPVAAGVLLCCVFPFTRRGRPFPLLGMLLVTAGLGLAGCGGGGSGSGGSSGSTPPAQTGTYTVTLTGHDSVSQSITSSTSLTLTIR